MNDVVDSTNLYPVNYYLLDELLLDQNFDQVESHVNVLLAAPSNTTVLCIFQESVPPDAWRDCLYKLIAPLRLARPNQQILVLMNVWYEYFNWDQLKELATDIHFINFFVMKCWFPLVNPGGVPTNQTWHQQSNQFLFLTGRPNKIHRIRLLYKLMRAGLKDFCTWSFAVQPKYESVCRKFFEELSDDEYNNFVANYTRVLDREYHDWNYVKHFSTVEQFSEIPKNNHFAFVSHDVTLYENKKFAIISETDFDRLFSHAWVTEKTFNHIINRVPFIMAGEHKTLKLLELLGFDTFRDLLAIPNYDDPDSAGYLTPCNRRYQFQHYTRQHHFHEFYQMFKDPLWPSIEEIYSNTEKYQGIVDECITNYQEPIQSDLERRLEAIVTNAVTWMQEPELLKDAGSRVDHNYQVFRALGYTEFTNVKNWCAKFGIDEAHTIDMLFNYNFNNQLDYEVSSWVKRTGKNLTC